MCRVIALPTICVAILCSVPGLLAGEPTSHEVSHPCCACKVCKLVREQKKLTVEHIQTGERTRVESLRDAQDWIVTACRAARRGQGEGRESREAANG